MVSVSPPLQASLLSAAELTLGKTLVLFYRSPVLASSGASHCPKGKPTVPVLVPFHNGLPTLQPQIPCFPMEKNAPLTRLSCAWSSEFPSSSGSHLLPQVSLQMLILYTLHTTSFHQAAQLILTCLNLEITFCAVYLEPGYIVMATLS